MAVTTNMLNEVRAYLFANNAPCEYIDAMGELIAQRENRTVKATAKRAQKSETANAAIADAVEAIINQDVFKRLEVIMNSDVRAALSNAGIESPSVQKATKALGMLVERGYLVETVPPKGVSCRCYRLAA